ncbi:MAG: hypothetical protein NUW37_16275 [Planctomycetes bacterium]|nr:hypothetical protein [Planctomycetota bacterium]
MVVYVEGKTDLTLISILGVPRKKGTRKGTRGEVVKAVDRGNQQDFGIIEEDPDGGNLPEILSTKYDEVKSLHGLRLLKHRSSNKYFIMIVPKLEQWCVERAKICKISLSDLDLPETAKKIHALERLHESSGFISLLKKLLDNDIGMQTLKSWIDERLSE